MVVSSYYFICSHTKLMDTLYFTVQRRVHPPAVKMNPNLLITQPPQSGKSIPPTVRILLAVSTQSTSTLMPHNKGVLSAKKQPPVGPLMSDLMVSG